MKKFITSIIIFITLLFSVFAVINSSSLSNGAATTVEDNFILTFLAILAVVVTVSAFFLYLNAEKLRSTLTGKMEFNCYFRKMFKETRENVLMVLSSLIVCYLVVLSRDIDFPILKYPSNFWLSKLQLISVIKLSVTILTLTATADIFIAIFNLTEIRRNVREEVKVCLTIHGLLQ